MKKILLLALALALLMSLSGCGAYVSLLPGAETGTDAAAPAGTAPEDGAAFQARPLLSFVGWDSFGETYYTDTPLALSYQPTLADGTRGCRAYVFDRGSIIAGCDALRGIVVTGRAWGEPVSSAEYTLTRADGPEYRLTFGALADGTRVLSTYTGDYVISGGDGLWDLAFPAYSADYDVFDLYFSDSVRRFADNFYANTPVSVGYRMNSGATITSTDPAAVTAAFQALADASVIVVENNPDQNVDLNQLREYIFTLADGTTYNFRFNQRCLSVTANAAFGPVYYWLDGVDALWNVYIAPEDTANRFQGGVVSDLREDIWRASQAADGAVEGVTVSGVFVEYTLGEDSGYLTLDGDTAYDFLRRACAVGVTAQVVEAPAGDNFRVSVTLSDGTGPMLSFSGDTIQQLVGLNLVCDSADMQALRGYILELAAAGNNTAEVGESTTD